MFPFASKRLKQENGVTPRSIDFWPVYRNRRQPTQTQPIDGRQTTFVANAEGVV
jgi:hypothetical protein